MKKCIKEIREDQLPSNCFLVTRVKIKGRRVKFTKLWVCDSQVEACEAITTDQPNDLFWTRPNWTAVSKRRRGDCWPIMPRRDGKWTPEDWGPEAFEYQA